MYIATTNYNEPDGHMPVALELQEHIEHLLIVSVLQPPQILLHKLSPMSLSLSLRTIKLTWLSGPTTTLGRDSVRSTRISVTMIMVSITL